MRLIPPWLMVNSTSIPYLAQFILTLAISAVLIFSKRGKSTATKLLAAFFACGAGFCLSIFMVTSTFFQGWRSWQYIFLLLAGTILLRFSYSVPKPFPEQKKESDIITRISLIIVAGIIVISFISPEETPLFSLIRIGCIILLVCQILGCQCGLV